MTRLICSLVLVSLVLSEAHAQVGIGDSNLRGVSAISDTIVWISGSKGVIARTLNGGRSWERLPAPQGAENYDFRDIEAYSADVAFLMSAGPGNQSRIWKTTDGGKTWHQQYANPAQEFFLDSLACWRDTQQQSGNQQCVALSDPVPDPHDNNTPKFLVLMTDDGEHWRELPRDHMPPALIEKHAATTPQRDQQPAATQQQGTQQQQSADQDLREGAFAASGTAITVLGSNIWFGTGGPHARVFHSADRGQTWSVADTPLMHGEASQGIFSIAFRDAKHGVIVGGDYRQPTKTGANLAFTSDGGKSWTLARPARPNSHGGAGSNINDLPYCSAVAYSTTPDRIDAAGLEGLYHIIGEGRSAEVYRTGEKRSFNAMSSNWLVGPSGSVLQRAEPAAPSLHHPGK